MLFTKIKQYTGDKSNHDAILFAMDFFANSLKFRKRTDILVDVLITKNKSFNYDGTCLHVDNYDNVHVFHLAIKANFKLAHTLEILAHEMVHMKQYMNGDLYYNHPKTCWKGKPYRTTDFEYSELPWEKEAYRKESLLVNALLKDHKIWGNRILKR